MLSYKNAKQNIYNIALLIFLIQLLHSCGTVNRQQNIIAIDSQPRGVKVIDEEGEVIGKTPFFHKVDPQRNQVFKFIARKNKRIIQKRKSYKCGLNWSGSVIIPTIFMPFFPYGTGFGASLLLTDWATGGIYSCEKNLFSTLSKKKLTKKRSISRRILHLPIFIKDKEFAYKLVNEWKQKWFKKGKNGRDILVNTAGSEEEISFLEIDNMKVTHPDKIREKDLHYLGEKFKVTHMIFFDISQKGDKKLVITPKLFDIFSRKEEKASYLKPFLVKKPITLRKGYLKYLMDVISFLPNSFMFKYNFDPDVRYLDNLTTTSFEKKIEDHPDTFPRYITMLGLGFVSHPFFYGNWDYAFSMFPTVSGNSWQTRYTGSDGDEYIIKMQNYNLFFNTGVVFHTPLGAFGLEYGFGGIFFMASDSRNQSINDFVGSSRMNLNYVGFLTKRFYLRLDVSSFDPKNRKMLSDRGTFDNWSEVTMGVGYYYPSIKSLVRKLLPY